LLALTPAPFKPDKISATATGDANMNRASLGICLRSFRIDTGNGRERGGSGLAGLLVQLGKYDPCHARSGFALMGSIRTIDRFCGRCQVGDTGFEPVTSAV
jgi:hypothetical protein